MKINRKTEYALAVVLYVAYAGKSKQIVNTSQIYDATFIPRKFLTIILSELQRSGILKSVRGSKGGYEIGKELSAISLYEIIDAVMPYENKKKERNVGSYRDLAATILAEITEEHTERLKGIFLSDLLKRLDNMFSPMTPMFYI